jgi:hypothetical protein
MSMENGVLASPKAIQRRFFGTNLPLFHYFFFTLLNLFQDSLKMAAIGAGYLLDERTVRMRKDPYDCDSITACVPVRRDPQRDRARGRREIFSDDLAIR